MGLDQYTLRDLSGSSSSSGLLLRQMFRIKTLLACIVIIGFVVFAFFKNWSTTQTSIVLILLISQLLEGIADTYFNIFRAEGQSVNESICRTIPLLIASLYGAVCLFFHWNILFFSLFFLINSSLRLIAAKYGAHKLFTFPQLHDTTFKLKPGHGKTIALIAAISFLGIFYNEVQVLLIKQLHTLTDVAQYKVASDMTNTLCGIVANLVIGAVLFPILVAAFKHENQFSWITRIYFKRIIYIGSGVAFFITLFNGTIIYFIFGEKYLTAISIAPMFGTTAFFSFINNFCIYVLLAMRQEKQLLLFLCVPVAISISIGPILISNIGPMGAVFSLLLCRVVLATILVTTLQKRLSVFQLAEYKHVVKYWLVAAIIFLVLGQFSYVISSRLALLVYCFLLWKNRSIFKIKAQNSACD